MDMFDAILLLRFKKIRWASFNIISSVYIKHKKQSQSIFKALLFLRTILAKEKIVIWLQSKWTVLDLGWSKEVGNIVWMGKQNLQQNHSYHKYSCKRAQRPARDLPWLGCPIPHTETKTGVCQVCVHCCVLSCLSFFSSPLCMSKILILEEILVGFCGQFGGGEMRVGIFVSAYKRREVYLSLASKATIRQVSQAWFAFTSQCFIEKRIFKVTMHGQAQSSYHSYRFVCTWIVRWYNSPSFVQPCLFLHITRDLLACLSLWYLQKVVLQPQVSSLTHGQTEGLPGPAPIVMWLCVSETC